MVDRIIVGDGGIRISKPGVDVNATQQGQFLFDGRAGSTIYQCVANGNIQLLAQDTTGAVQSGSRSLAMGAAFSTYSDLFVWSCCDFLFNGAVTLSAVEDAASSVSVRQ